RGLLAPGGQAPVRDEGGAVVHAEDGVGVAKVDGQEHGQPSEGMGRSARASPERMRRDEPLGARTSRAPVVSTPSATPTITSGPLWTSTARPHQGTEHAIQASTVCAGV